MRLLAWVAGFLCVASVAGADPTPDQKQRADKLFDDGRKYLASKEYALACTAFEQSQEADPAIGTELNIALCYEQWGKVVAAFRAYQESERLARLRFDDRAKGAHDKVAELSPKVPHLQLALPADADPSAVYLLDGKEIERAALDGELLVEIGRHEIEARVAGKPAKRSAIDIKLGEHAQLVVDVPTPEIRQVTTIVSTTPRNRGRLYGGIALTAGGGIAIGTAAFIALVARQDYANALKNCPDHMCTTSRDYNTTQSARKRANYMTFVGAGGAVLAAVGVYLIVTSHGHRIEQVAVQPLIGSDMLGLAIGGNL